MIILVVPWWAPWAAAGFAAAAGFISAALVLVPASRDIPGPPESEAELEPREGESWMMPPARS